MQKILKKRTGREFKENIFRYLALGLLIVLGMYLVVSLLGASETIIRGVNERAERNHLEDGEFSAFLPLTKEGEDSLKDHGITLEKQFYLDFKEEDQSVLRVFSNREKVNRIDLDYGKLAQKRNEIVLEKRYCEEHHLKTGDSITMAGKQYKITGIGSVPDYDAPYRELSDTVVDSKTFGLAFVSKAEYKQLKESGKSEQSEQYTYAYRLNGRWSHTQLKKAINNLTQFMKAGENPRIKASFDDQRINKLASLLSGVIIMVLFTYVISVFVIHGIQRESSVIGALYSLGVKRRDLMLHYLLLPVVVTFIAGVIGTFLGYSALGVPVQTANCYTYFSVPKLPVLYLPYILIYGILMPPIAAAAVNFIVIRKELSKPALSLLKNEQKESRISNINLGTMGFVGRFRIRQMLREMRTGFTVVFGMFVSLLILMLGLNCYAVCSHISEDNKRDTKYEYMYTYKYPDAKVPKGGEACMIKSLKKEIYGYNLDITLLGIEKNNPYFNANVKEGKNKLVISSAMAQKYNLSVGNQVILSDKEEGMDYAFTVSDIAQYSTALYAFMDIDSMRELFHEKNDYYNAVFSKHPLKIDARKLYGVSTRDDVKKSSDVFTDKMSSLIYMMTAVAVLIFCVVMYLMMKVMMDRSAVGISLVKIFGYRTKEIRKLYLNGNFYMIAIGAAICLPLAKKAMDAIYPLLVSNIGSGMDLTFSWQMYAGIYGAILVLYFVINQVLVRRISHMVPAEILKNRE